jgi:NAD(P)-dependent dehydrogenase (short-subunit alcohol dehydrogenase family)
MKTLDQFDIEGRSALITGAASGLGLAYAETMAEAGASVTLTDIDGEGVAREAARICAEGGRARAAQLDVRDRDGMRGVFDEHVAKFGGLDICFANAGVDPGPGFWNPGGFRNENGQIDTLDAENDWDKSLSINLTGIFNTIRESARCMKACGKGGSIIATASNAGLFNDPIVGMAYMPAKAGALHMVRHVALELAEYGIRVNAIAPGPFITNIGDGWVKKNPVAKAAFDKTIPLGGMAETGQIKPLALLLASDASGYMTGSHVVIDGGVVLGNFR